MRDLFGAVECACGGECGDSTAVVVDSGKWGTGVTGTSDAQGPWYATQCGHGRMWGLGAPRAGGARSGERSLGARDSPPGRRGPGAQRGMSY